MSTGNTLRIITGALLVIAFMSATAFATVGEPKVTNEIISNNVVEIQTLQNNTYKSIVNL